MLGKLFEAPFWQLVLGLAIVVTLLIPLPTMESRITTLFVVGGIGGLLLWLTRKRGEDRSEKSEKPAFEWTAREDARTAYALIAACCFAVLLLLCAIIVAVWLIINRTNPWGLLGAAISLLLQGPIYHPSMDAGLVELGSLICPVCIPSLVILIGALIYRWAKR
jgi:hypothetical protein